MSFAAICRWHRSWFIPIEIGLLVAVIAGWWIMARSPMARLRASGAPVTFADLSVDAIPDEENAAVVLREASTEIEDFGSDLEAFYKAEAGIAYAEIDTMAPLPSEMAIAIRQLVDSHADLEKTLTEVARTTRYASTMGVDRLAVTTSMRSVQRWRTFARYATLQQRAALAASDVPRAVRTTLETLRLGAHLANEPLIMRRLVSVAISSIGMHQAERLIVSVDLNTAQANELEAELHSLEERPAVRATLEAERVFSLDCLDQFPAYQGIFYRSSVLREFERVLALTELPLHEAATAIRTTPPTVGALVPGIDTVLTAETRLAAKARCLRVVLALSQKGGPATSEALGLPAETLTDPFTGRPLRVESIAATGGWRVSSTGPDQLFGQKGGPELDDNITVAR